jgi:predicted metal-dependent hydrolase
MIALFLLIVINLFILRKTQEPQRLKEVKEKYRILREHLDETNNETYSMLTRAVPITGVLRMNDGIGYNTNKGGDIVLCLDGEPNEIFHVLIHELAHCTVEEYDHSEQFWENYIELRDICVHIGIYEKISIRTEFCGEHIQDK